MFNWIKNLFSQKNEVYCIDCQYMERFEHGDSREFDPYRLCYEPRLEYSVKRKRSTAIRHKSRRVRPKCYDQNGHNDCKCFSPITE